MSSNYGKNTADFIEELELRVTRLEKHGIPGVRDFFATSALSMLAREGSLIWGNTTIAHNAYAIADAMIEERKKSASTK